MNWIVAADNQLVGYFEHENVWEKKWVQVTGEYAAVLGQRGAELKLPVWEATFNGKRKRFVADEVYNGVWLFALPSP